MFTGVVLVAGNNNPLFVFPEEIYKTFDKTTLFVLGYLLIVIASEMSFSSNGKNNSDKKEITTAGIEKNVWYNYVSKQETKDGKLEVVLDNARGVANKRIKIVINKCNFPKIDLSKPFPGLYFDINWEDNKAQSRKI